MAVWWGCVVSKDPTDWDIPPDHGLLDWKATRPAAAHAYEASRATSKAFRPGLQAYREPEPGTLEWYRNLPAKVPYSDEAFFKITWKIWVRAQGFHMSEPYPDIQDTRRPGQYDER